MRAGEHGHLVPFGRHRRKPVAQGGERRQIRLFERLPEREGHGRVIDILRGEPEVDEFCVSAQPERFHPLFEEVFDGLHVVVGRGLDRLDALGVGQAEITVEAAQGLPCGRIDPLELGERQLAQGDEIFDLDADAVADQCVLGKIIGELPRCIAVTTVNG